MVPLRREFPANRLRILDLLRQRPGLHLRRISRELSIPLTTLEYHLHQLERTGVVVCRHFGIRKAFFLQDEGGRRDKDYLYYLRQPFPRRIIIALALHGRVSHARLRELTHVSAGALTAQLSRMISSQLVEVVGRDGSHLFRLRNPARLRRLVDRYATAFREPGDFRELLALPSAETGPTLPGPAAAHRNPLESPASTT